MLGRCHINLLILKVPEAAAAEVKTSSYRLPEAEVLWTDCA